jgi:hypothetical protein
MKLKSAITKADDESPGIKDIIGYVEYTVTSEDDLYELFMIDEVVEAGYFLEPYVIVPETIRHESKSPSRDNY